MNAYCRIALALVIILWLALPSTEANAVSTVVTGGSIIMNTTTPAPFDDVFISLRGQGFSLTNHFLHDSFQFTGTPNPRWVLLTPGTMVDFTGGASLRAPTDLLVFNGVSYRASGTISVSTLPAAATTIMTEPFTLAGVIHGQSLSGPQTVDLSLGGSGMVTAQFHQLVGTGLLTLRSITYNVTAIPEPGTWVLLGTGLAWLAGWRRMKRVAVSASARQTQDEYLGM